MRKTALFHVRSLVESAAQVHSILRVIVSAFRDHLALCHRSLLTHLNADVIQFLHAHKLPQILLRLNLAVLQSIVVLHAELIKGGAAITDSFFKLLHDGRMLLNEFLDSLDL